MNISEFSVKRPVSGIMFYVALALLGAVALFRIPLEFMPKSDFPELQIDIPYRGSTPTEVEKRITKPIEEAIAQIPGVKKIESTSSSQQSTLRISFDIDTYSDFMVLDVRERIDQIRDELPADMDTLFIWKFDTESLPIFFLGIYVKDETIDYNTLIDQRIVRRIKAVDGVAFVEVFGKEKRRVYVELIKDRMVKHDISMIGVYRAITAGNMNMNTGDVLHNGKRYSVRVVGEFSNINDVKDLIIKPGVRLSDIASVEFDYDEPELMVRIDRNKAMMTLIRKESGANTVEVCRDVLKVIDEIENDPALASIGLMKFFNQGREISRSIGALTRAGLLGWLLTFLTTYFFLRNFSLTVILSLSIPTSIIGTIMVMHVFLDMTFNMVSMSALMLSVGILVDNSIVVLENIHTKSVKGMDRVEASIKGPLEVRAALMVATATTLIVFLPLVFATKSQSVTIMAEFGTVLCLAIAASLLVAFTLIPLLTSKFLKAGKGGVMQAEPRWFTVFKNFYIKILRRLLERRMLGVAVVLGVLFSVLIPRYLIDKELMPEAMMRMIKVDMHLSKAMSMKGIDKKVQDLEEIFWKHRERWGIKTMAVFFGPDFMNMNIILPDDRALTMPWRQVKNEIKALLPVWPGVRFDMENMGMQGEKVGGVNVRVIGEDPDTLIILAEKMRKRMATVPTIIEVKPVKKKGDTQMDIKIDRDLARLYGFDVTRAAYEISYSIRGSRVGWLNTADRQLDIFMQLNEKDRGNVSELSNLPLESDLGEFISLKGFADITPVHIQKDIEREDRERLLAINLSYGEKDLAKLKKRIQKAFKGFTLPTGYRWSMGGKFDDMQDSFKTLFTAIILALILVFLLMIAQFESFFIPFIVMFSIPFAMVGVFWGLFLTGNTLNILSGTGMLLLSGIVVNNAIVLVSHISDLRKAGLNEMESLIQASHDRLRPILMTAMTTIMGLVPMAMGSSDPGRAVYAPLAIAVLGGFVSSTIMIPLVIPLIYSLTDDLNSWMKKGWVAARSQSRAAGK